ncbi:type-F conjugative transfer system mating-pair stabilization protein TraN [Escherichia marmotae]|uniref:Type-F conjugative transfer system mating-pair stabilization protein TraN n=1 Tax=Escherichia marmotae TaxID=1499973 RepID=A0ABU1C6U4_9ESCH|nr:type-F conjugative transfer system mating-pair stabilization protein TraN [Escherichia marmotae]MDQ9215071.1 type-F conjugative transfer system mating-pair stabilization protein TraN [Escherichia marmotae]MDQ9229666.1 type-F conjugative transfer system mating-pair stabilization protein TraN [Escherichia marmotae]MDQ9234270.1 type-F conjugative transfer system mating-pair stabilization protein TraN [Escherichia marmotae]MDQ9253267.1 type-F conjugative transfer system mating-pair stabilization
MKRVIVMMLAALTTFGTGLQASDKYSSGKQFADSLKGNGSGVLNNFKPGEVIPGYTENPPESAHYGGVTSSNSASLESAGASALNNSEVGKLTSEVIMNRPKDPISMDAPFISGGFDVQDKADIVTNGTHDKCETVNVSKTEITSHVCERTPAAELTCIRKAHIGGKYEESWHTQWLEYEMNQLPSSEVNGQYVVSIPSPVTGEIISAHYSWRRVYIQKSDNMVITVLGSRLNWNSKTSVDAPFTPVQKTLTAGVPFTSSHPTRAGSIRFKRHTSMKLRLQVKVKTETWKPVVEWTESCPFNKAEEVLQGSQCTEAGGNRVISMGGKEYTVYSDCWAWKDTYLKQEADNGSCDVYMKNPACTASRVNCQEKSGSACLQEEVTFSCEKKVTGEAQLCSGQLVCANGECDVIENGTSDGFGKAVSALAAVTAAAQDVAAMNDVNVRAFTGKPVECRMAIAGFNNCCKDSGWGQGIGLAHCDSEEKALGKAKEKLLTVYVGTYCSKKVLGVCLQKKKAYCQFDSKLAQIVQAQGRKGQLGIGFGSGKHPDCRGITVEELQSLRFDRMDFSNFYSDLNAGTTIPSDSELAERVKEQVASALQQSAGKGQ